VDGNGHIHWNNQVQKRVGRWGWSRNGSSTGSRACPLEMLVLHHYFSVGACFVSFCHYGDCTCTCCSPVRGPVPVISGIPLGLDLLFRYVHLSNRFTVETALTANAVAWSLASEVIIDLPEYVTFPLSI
jgi:hypothetical protein